MLRGRMVRAVAAAVAAVALSAALGRQEPWPPEGPPLPPAPRPLPEDRAPAAPAPPEEAAEPRPERPWHIGDDVRAKLARAASRYREHALRFTCIETVRAASYDEQEEASEESVRRYAYLLEREGSSETLREYRQAVRDDGTPKGREVRDEDPFPPAYAWVQMFDEFHQSYFAFRDLGERFEGYDWVREVEFLGALPFTDGKDIRQWSGTVLVDAMTWSPVEIRAVPSGQEARLRAVYARWSQAFNLFGFRLAPKPLIYSCFVQFGLRRDGLSFPTELRYDTRMAVSATRSVPRRASSRRYEDYRFFKTATVETPGAPVGR